MRKNGILNEHINRIIASLGHTETIAIGDCGLPIPNGPERVDISLVRGIPSFKDVVSAISSEMIIEKIYIAQEMKAKNGACYEFLTDHFHQIEVVEIPHEELKERLESTKAVIRTGEATPYSNVILVAGVNF